MMVNTLFLPELREMLATGAEEELREFCTALHPARTAEFMEGLTREEQWKVLQYAEPPLRAEIFSYFPHDRQIEMLLHENEKQVAELITHIPADDAVDLLSELPERRVEQLLALVPAPDRRDIRRLQTFPEGTAGSIMTTEAACLDERLTVRQALEKLSRQAERLETIYYIYVVDDTNHLRGVLSTRMLVSSIGKPERTIAELMDTDIVTVDAYDDQEKVAQIVAKYDLLAIPVVDEQRHMLGIITHDDVMDVVREEATEDVQRIAAVDPLEDSYIRTSILTLARKRGMWLGILFFAGLITAFALRGYESEFESYAWLVWFIPLIIGSGGNSGAQTSTLIIAAMAAGEVDSKQWWRIIVREIATGGLLGLFLASLALTPALLLAPSAWAATVVPLTILFVVLCGTFSGSILPLLFRRLGWDPALMSNPFVAGIMDITGIVVYVTIARAMLG
ncbi:MAG: magnesium transporter MgtE [Pirellulaceae bacterium]|nr:MAG: magnesium transporter MgtE [Pirellulaceae bacterium]